MKPYNLLWILCTGLMSLTACSNMIDYNRTQVKPDLSQETWLKNVNLDTRPWLKNADSWFLTGKPTAYENANNTAPFSKAITTMSVRVPDFTSIKVEGRIHVQIVGGQEHNSAYIYGPNEAARQTIVEICGDTICIHETKNCNTKEMNNIIVRLGVRNLTKLAVSDSANVEGKNIKSNILSIKSSSSSDVLLAGNMNLADVTQTGLGTVTVMGAETPSLNLHIASRGTINVSGRVGIRSVSNYNGGTINIIGADSDALSIVANGKGSTSIAGYVNLKKVIAANDSRVYIYWVNSNGAYISIFDRARVGLAGSAKNINIDVAGVGRYEGQYLRGDNVYVRTRNSSHANVLAAKKLFAAALDNSSIYFFGSPNIVSRYTSRDGIVIPVWSDTNNLPSTSLPPLASTTDWSPAQSKGMRSYKGDTRSYKNE